MTHPAVLTAITSLASLRASYRWLDDVLEPGNGRPATRAVSPAGRAAQRRQAAAERDDRHALAGSATAGTTAAPVNVAAIDAQTLALTTATDAAWLVSSELRARPLLVFGGAWTVARADRWAATSGYLAIALPHAGPQLAADVGPRLEHADRAVRNACGVGSDRRRLPGHQCPGCGRLSLEAEVSAPDRDHWTIVCNRSCRCSGTACQCNRAERYFGAVHIWAASEFPHLADILTATLRQKAA